MCEGGPTQVYERAIFDTADAFRCKLRVCCPRFDCFRRFANKLTDALTAFAGSHFPRPQVRGEVVVGSHIVGMLASVYLVTCMRKLGCY